MANSNRFPRASGAVARDYRSDRPLPKYRPDNDNRPDGYRPRPKPWIPANDNRPVPTPVDWGFPSRKGLPGWERMWRLGRHAFPVGVAAYTAYQWYFGEGGFSPAEHGFELVCTTPLPKEIWTWASGTASNTCMLGGQSTAGGQAPEDFTVPALPNAPPGSFIGQVIRAYMPTGTDRGTQSEEWWRWTTSSQPPGGYPEVVPDTPVLPRLPPNWKPDEWPDPWTDPWVNPLPPTPPEPRRRPHPRDRPLRPRLPEDKVQDEPSLPREPEFRVEPDPRERPLPRRPRKRERERKIRIKDMPHMRLRRTLGWLISAASEAGDMLDLLYGALPKELQSEDANVGEKFETVFKHLDEVNFDKFVSDLWQNEVQDRYFGKGFKDMTGALEELGLSLPSLKI